MEYLKEDSSLPVPLNIIPTLKMFERIFNNFIKLFYYCRRKEFKMRKNKSKNLKTNQIPFKRTSVNNNGQMNIATIENIGHNNSNNSHLRKQSIANELTYAVVFIITYLIILRVIYFIYFLYSESNATNYKTLYIVSTT
jgi:hypothetical protein